MTNEEAYHIKGETPHPHTRPIDEAGHDYSAADITAALAACTDVD